MNVNFNKLPKFIGTTTEQNTVLYTGNSFSDKEGVLYDSTEWYRSVYKDSNTCYIQDANIFFNGDPIYGESLYSLLDGHRAEDPNLLIVIAGGIEEYRESLDSYIQQAGGMDNLTIIWYRMDDKIRVPEGFRYYI